jgi:phosphate transport system substrate-binding protein
MRALATCALTLALGLAPAACDRSGQTATPAGIVSIDGSSTVFPICEAVAEEFQRAHPARVTIGVSGTGGGMQKFCKGEVDIANASRPIQKSEIEACRKAGLDFIELPVAYDGIAVVVHPKNAWVDHLTVAELRTMWAPEAQGKITRWNQIRPSFPDRELHLFGPGTDSGTFDYFTHAICGKERSSRGDFTSSEDDNVLVQGIATDEAALGYFGYAYYQANRSRLKLVPVDDGQDDNGPGPVAPDERTIAVGTYQPLSRPLFVYVSTRAAARPEIRAFVDYFLSHSRALVTEVGYVPLPERAYELARERFARRRTGSLFAGEGVKIGLTIEALLAAEAG